MNRSVLEAFFGRSLARPKWAKARAQKTSAIEKAEVVVNVEVALVILAPDELKGEKEIAELIMHQERPHEAFLDYRSLYR